MKHRHTCWVKCLDCDHRQMEKLKSLSRRTAPRCTVCGGPVLHSDDSAEKLLLSTRGSRDLGYGLKGH